jgi:Flp pilus assembly protein TadB
MEITSEEGLHARKSGGEMIEPKTTNAPSRRDGGLRPVHGAAIAVSVVVAVVVAFWALSFLAGILASLVKVVVIVAIVALVVRLVRHRARS